MSTDVERIKQALDIVDVIGEYVRLKQAGQNFKGLCPFHGEKSPSFMVHRERQMWHCFGCNIGGDMFEFVKKIENVEFPEALELLARKAGVELTRQAPGESNKRLRLFEAVEVASVFFKEQLKNSPLANRARDYVESRKITTDSVNIFGVGYSLPEWDKLIIFLRGKGFLLEELITAGLALKSERGPGAYDRFRDRLIFTINDAQGRAIGFGGRTLVADTKEAKYINSPQSPIYDKSSVVYNLDRAKQYIKDEKYVVLVEGYMDVIASWQAGVKNVVATSGTALTPAQVKIIKRYTDEVRVCFDTDLAGKTASDRGVDLLLAAEMEVKIVTLPFGKDPDECARQSQTAYQQAIKNALAIGDHAFKTVLKEVDITTREGKKQAADRLLQVIVKLPNQVEQDHYLKLVSNELGIDERSVRERFFSLIKKDIKSNQSQSIEFNLTSSHTDSVVLAPAEKTTEQLLCLLILAPNLFNEVINLITPNMAVGVKLAELYKQFLVQYNERHRLDLDELKLELTFSPELIQLINVLNIKAAAILADQPTLDTVHEVKELCKTLKRLYWQNEKSRLHTMIRQAEQSGQAEQLSKLVEEFTIVSRELNNL